jgi:hypothetical protein
MNQLNSKAPEKSHATEQLFGYNCLYGTYLGHIFRQSVYGSLVGRMVAMLIDGPNIEQSINAKSGLVVKRIQ